MAAAGSGVIAVALLSVLWLFIDLMIWRGRIPDYEDLAPRQQARFQRYYRNLAPEQRQELFEHAGVSAAEVTKAFDELTPDQHQLLWKEHVWDVLHTRVGIAAAECRKPILRVGSQVVEVDTERTEWLHGPVNRGEPLDLLLPEIDRQRALVAAVPLQSQIDLHRALSTDAVPSAEVHPTQGISSPVPPEAAPTRQMEPTRLAPRGPVGRELLTDLQPGPIIVNRVSTP